MALGTHNRLLVSTALSVVLSTTAFMAQPTSVAAQTVVTFPDGTVVVLPAGFDPRFMPFPDGVDPTLFGYPADYDPSDYTGPAPSGGVNHTPIASAPMTHTPTASEPVGTTAGTVSSDAGAGMDGMDEDMDEVAMPVPSGGMSQTPVASDSNTAPPVIAGMEPTQPDTPVDPVDPIDPVDPVDPDVDPPRPDDIPVAGPLPTFDGIGLSALSPPENVVLTQAIEITAGPVGVEQFVQATGQTLFGAVMDPGAFDIVEVEMLPSGRQAVVDVSPMTGQFATRVFEDDFGNDGSVTVNLIGANSTSDEVQTEPVSYTLQQALPEDGFVQALSRITYGATPQLYAQVRSMGFAAYVEQQLDPDEINDAFFISLATDDLIDRDETNVSQVLNQITEHTIAQAAYSAKQLQEVMGAFWSNHFHASEKGASMQMQAADDRAFFRENAFGTFEDLLNYSARSPLMSRFLDNTDSRRGLLNENYGREVLELHTVGVDGGYDDDDVIAVSRVFTGWTYEWTNDEEPARSEEPRNYVFDFREDRHDFDDKEIPFLGITITGREGPEGEIEGSELIAALSNDARTQGYVCGKIVQKFVADVPPQNFVDNCVSAWQASGGSTEAMLRAILLDPAYINTPELQRTKAKTPLEYAVSFVRAFDYLPSLDREASFFGELRQAVTAAGQDATRFPVPTGLAEVGSAWLNGSTIIEQYKEITNLARNTATYGSDIQSLLLAAGLETAEEAAAFMLAIATADRYREVEYNAVVSELKGTDGFFEPATEDEAIAIRRAVAVIAATPSFHLQ